MTTDERINALLERIQPDEFLRANAMLLLGEYRRRCMNLGAQVRDKQLRAVMIDDQRTWLLGQLSALVEPLAPPA